MVCGEPLPGHTWYRWFDSIMWLWDEAYASFLTKRKRDKKKSLNKKTLEKKYEKAK